MKQDINGCSTCQAGDEQYESFEYRGKTLYQYDYRTPEGQLFSCIATSINEARLRRDNWLSQMPAVYGDTCGATNIDLCVEDSVK